MRNVKYMNRKIRIGCFILTSSLFYLSNISELRSFSKSWKINRLEDVSRKKYHTTSIKPDEKINKSSMHIGRNVQKPVHQNSPSDKFIDHIFDTYQEICRDLDSLRIQINETAREFELLKMQLIEKPTSEKIKDEINEVARNLTALKGSLILCLKDTLERENKE